MIAYGVYMLTIVLGCQYDLEVKGQCEVKLNQAVFIVMPTPPAFFKENIHN